MSAFWYAQATAAAVVASECMRPGTASHFRAAPGASAAASAAVDMY
jgi:hypothetical protein